MISLIIKDGENCTCADVVTALHTVDLAVCYKMPCLVDSDHACGDLGYVVYTPSGLQSKGQYYTWTSVIFNE